MGNKKTRERNAAFAFHILDIVNDLDILIQDIWQDNAPEGDEGNELANALFQTQNQLQELAAFVESGQLDACFPKSCVLSHRGRKLLNAAASLKLADGVCEDLVVEKANKALRGKYDACTVSRRDQPALEPQQRRKTQATKAAKAGY